MIEILFSESAAGSMKLAKDLKAIAGEAFGILFHTDDGHMPTGEELARERVRVEEERRKKFENAIPVEGTSLDVAYFPLSLSMGDISAPLSGCRAEYLQSLVLIGGTAFGNVGTEMMDAALESLKKVRSALAGGQPIRIWYSSNPDELCGLCHILTLLPENADIRVVELPEYEVLEGEVRSYCGWGSIEPTDLGRFQALERKLTDTEQRHFTGLWRELETENGPLRAVVNGKLCTVDDNFYDTFILRELEKQPEEFHEGRLIGTILGKYPLGLSDSLIALRIEEWISQGMLTPLTEPEQMRPIYHRYLKKGGQYGTLLSDA